MRNKVENYEIDFKFDKEVEEKKEKEVQKGSIRELIKDKTYFINLVVLTTCWTCSSVNYYMIGFQLKHLKGSIYLNSILSSLFEVIAVAVGGAMVKLFGTKMGFIIAFSLSTLGALLIILVDEELVGKVIFAIFVFTSRFGVSATFAMVFIVTNDYFPPAMAGLTFGFCNLVARSFTVFSPMIAELPDPWPMAIFCLVAVAACVAVLFIREVKEDTKGINMELNRV